MSQPALNLIELMRLDAGYNGALILHLMQSIAALLLNTGE